MLLPSRSSIIIAVAVLFCATRAATQQTNYSQVDGDFVLRSTVHVSTGSAPLVRVVATAQPDGARVYWEWTGNPTSALTVRLLRQTSASAAPAVLETKQVAVPPAPALNITVQRRGSFFFLYIGKSPLSAQPDLYTHHPSFDVNCQSYTVAGDERRRKRMDT